MSIKLNAFSVQFSSPSLTAWVTKGGPTEIRELREEHGRDWFFHLRDGRIYGVPTGEDVDDGPGDMTELAVDEHLWVLKGRIADELPNVFEKYEPFRRRPFSILAQNQNLVREIAKEIGVSEATLRGIQIRPYIELDPRVVEFEEGNVRVAIVMDVGTRWHIHRPVDELANLGVAIPGLVVVRRQPGEGERRVAGRVASVEGDVVKLAESLDDIEEIAVDEVWLEGSRASFSRCLSTILGRRTEAFEAARTKLTGRVLSGPGLLAIMRVIGEHLAKHSPISLAPGLTCTVGAPVSIERRSKAVASLDPVEYCFDAAKSKKHQFAWAGLQQFGPYSRDTLAVRSPRILVAFPARVQGRVEQFLQVLQEGTLQGGRSQFSAGFASTFGLRNPKFQFCSVDLSSNGNPGRAYRLALESAVAGSETEFQAAIVVLPDEHHNLPPSTNPYLHAKAFLLTNGIPTQAIRTSKVTRRPEQLQWILPDFCVGLYAKLGGTPWSVAQDLTVNDELVLGVGTALVGESRFRERQRNVGITTVFRGDGSYLLSNLARECSFEEYPEELRAATIQVLREVKKRNGWEPGDTVRLVFHHAQPMKRVDVGKILRECAAEVAGDQQLQFAFVTVTQDHPFSVLDMAQRGVRKRDVLKAVHVPERGTAVQLGAFTQLVSTKGPQLVKGPDTPLPRPLLVNLHRDSTYVDLDYLTEQVLRFTSLSSRSTMPARTPVSILYSHLIASLLGRLAGVPQWSSAVVNTKLRASRWFL